MKYIIEIKPEYEGTTKGIIVLGIKNNCLCVDELAIEELEELNSDYINEHFGSLQDDAYQKGFEDGKAVDDKGCEGCKYANVAGTHEPCVRCSNSYENQWTAKDNKIEVGDEVYCKGDDESDSGVVTWAGKDRVCAMWQDGSAGEVQKDELIKTGRHFDIKSILEEMRYD